MKQADSADGPLLRVIAWLRRVLGIALLIFGATWLRPAAAMEFRLYFQPQLKINLLIAEGPIVAGDAARFLQYAPQADRDAEGHVVLVLNSLGGSVPAAFEFAAAMDKIGVFTVVPDNALCASACASIIYPSGVRRDVVGTGRLGFHSCYTKAGDKVEESALCNEKIAQHAISRGLAHASVSLFVNDFGARSMAWVDRQVACRMLIGMCRPTLRVTEPSDSEIRPSFNCSKAHSLVEKLICANPQLARLDARMSIAYFSSRSKADSPKALLDEQRDWLRNDRNGCNDLQCLLTVYTERTRVLEALMDKFSREKNPFGRL